MTGFRLGLHEPGDECHAYLQPNGELGEVFRGFFAASDFEGIELVVPTRTFRDFLEIDLAASLSEPGRLAVNVETVYQFLTPHTSAAELFVRMAKLESGRS